MTKFEWVRNDENHDEIVEVLKLGQRVIGRVTRYEADTDALLPTVSWQYFGLRATAQTWQDDVGDLKSAKLQVTLLALNDVELWEEFHRS